MKIVLHGDLADKYQKEYQVTGSKLLVVLNGLPKPLKDEIVRSECAFVLTNEGTDEVSSIDPMLINQDLSNWDTLSIIGKVQGEAPAVILIAGYIAAMGVSMATATLVAQMILLTVVMIAIGGIASLIMGTPSTGTDGSAAAAEAAKRKSFLFNGSINTTEQGGAVPLVYGFTRTGSTVISAGIDTITNSTGKWAWAT
jgi:predicted phage tail protein